MSENPDLAMSAKKVAAISPKPGRLTSRTWSPTATRSERERRCDVVGSGRSLVALIRGLNEDEQIDLVALTWLCHGNGDLDDWQDLRAEAARAHNKRTAEYFLGMPVLGDYPEESLSELGHLPEEFKQPV